MNIVEKKKHACTIKICKYAVTKGQGMQILVGSGGENFSCGILNEQIAYTSAVSSSLATGLVSYTIY